MSDCSTSAMKPKEVHCKNTKECVEMGVVVPDECFRHCHGGDSDAVRFERLAQVALEMLETIRVYVSENLVGADQRLEEAICEPYVNYLVMLESLGVSVDD